MSWIHYIANIFGAVLLVFIIAALTFFVGVVVTTAAVLMVPVGIFASPWIPHWLGVNSWPGLKWRKNKGPGMRTIPRGVPTEDMEQPHKGAR